MIVTKIEAVTKTKYKVYIDGQFAFVLYKGELSRYHLQEENEVSEDIVQKITGEVLTKRAKLRAMHLLNDMGRTERQLYEKLKRDRYPERVIAEAMSYVKSFGYINDQNYAESFIMANQGKKSRKEIYMRLISKGIDKETAERAMEECYGEEASDSAIENLMRKKRFDPMSATREESRKFAAYLVRKGFSYGDIRKVIQASEWTDEAEF